MVRPSRSPTSFCRNLNRLNQFSSNNDDLGAYFYKFSQIPVGRVFLCFSFCRLGCTFSNQSWNSAPELQGESSCARTAPSAESSPWLCFWLHNDRSRRGTSGWWGILKNLWTCKILISNGFTIVVEEQIGAEPLLSAGDELGVTNPFFSQRAGHGGTSVHHAEVPVLIHVRVHFHVAASAR